LVRKLFGRDYLPFIARKRYYPYDNIAVIDVHLQRSRKGFIVSELAGKQMLSLRMWNTIVIDKAKCNHQPVEAGT